MNGCEEQAVTGRPERTPRVSKLALYHGFLCEKVKEYPTICASRLATMARDRGFDGSDRIVQRYVRDVRPAKPARAYLVCERLPGEQAQIDWGHVGRIAVAGGFRALWVFVLYLAYSRMRYAELVLDLTAESLRRSFVRAITFLGGSTRQWLFDNAKTVVLERHGGAARLHPGLLELAGSLRVNPVLARVRTPTDKGGVERSIRDLKTGFFAGRTITDLARGNELLHEHIWTVIARRPHPTLPGCTVAEAFEKERERLMPLPQELPQTELVLPVAVDKTASVRFGTNRYSVSAGARGRHAGPLRERRARATPRRQSASREPRAVVGPDAAHRRSGAPPRARGEPPACGRDDGARSAPRCGARADGALRALGSKRAAT